MPGEAVSLVVGADGFIGRALADHLAGAGEPVLATTRRRDTVSESRIFLDLAHDVSDWCPPCPVSVAYLCAAVSSLDVCRRERAQSTMVNVHSTVALARTLVTRGAFVIFPSTNLVFDSSSPFHKADDPVSPCTEYGRQKAQAERQLLALGQVIAVVRFTKILGPNMPLFTQWIQTLQNHGVIHPFTDLGLSPISLAFAVQVLHSIAEQRLPGIFQVSGASDITYVQVAHHLAQRLGVSPDLVQPVKPEEAGLQLEVIRPYSTLDTTRLRTEFGMQPPPAWLTIDSLLGLCQE
jgi:dTDP-4-dehydrorhamnose reductase